jgi:UDP-N-acetylglucosamine 2-epimerase (non-hydrolysing)
MKPGQSLSELTAQLLLKLEEYFKTQKPHLILAHGDTSTCFATALSSFYHQIPFFHVEAGLRTYRLTAPFPEEFNRQSITPLATHHFAPTETEQANLLREGVPSSRITVTGSTVHDAVRTIRMNSPELNLVQKKSSAPLVLVTLHRRETSSSLPSTLQGLREAALKQSDALFICPVHPNPVVQSTFKACLGDMKNVLLTEPMEYPRFISHLMQANLIMTDSGGVQEEAAFLGKRVLLARSETERFDGIRSGLVSLMNINPKNICNSILNELKKARSESEDVPEYQTASCASQIIAEKVLRLVG